MMKKHPSEDSLRELFRRAGLGSRTLVQSQEGAFKVSVQAKLVRTEGYGVPLGIKSKLNTWPFYICYGVGKIIWRGGENPSLEFVQKDGSVSIIIGEGVNLPDEHDPMDSKYNPDLFPDRANLGSEEQAACVLHNLWRKSVPSMDLGSILWLFSSLKYEIIDELLERGPEHVLEKSNDDGSWIINPISSKG